jgi:hypothetical protein
MHMKCWLGRRRRAAGPTLVAPGFCLGPTGCAIRRGSREHGRVQFLERRAYLVLTVPNLRSWSRRPPIHSDQPRAAGADRLGKSGSRPPAGGSPALRRPWAGPAADGRPHRNLRWDRAAPGESGVNHEERHAEHDSGRRARALDGLHRSASIR